MWRSVLVDVRGPPVPRGIVGPQKSFTVFPLPVELLACDVKARTLLVERACIEAVEKESRTSRTGAEDGALFCGTSISLSTLLAMSIAPVLLKH